MLHDEYKDGGPWLRRWQLVAGQPRCLDDAVAPDHPDADAIRNRNDRVRQAIEMVEGFEAARMLIARVEADEMPAETITVPVLIEGVQPNPAHATWETAVQLLASTPDEPPELVMMDGLGEVPNPARIAWWAARDAVANGEPPATIPTLIDGIDAQPNPAWVAYRDALSLVSGADDSTRALALLRAATEPPAELLDDGQPNPDRAAWEAAIALVEAVNEPMEAESATE
ncbi:hypothetical protein TSH100_04200 [Azospirillum sp. TSH100]|uniref:hypothetical protein n=1 Tax=Azospirillum sp. TSH100 TaxID=652764 RepID=UPI000D616FCB|nr:hypothetical protein [Azospirillum sp. TSH100]PWC89846.1 hypothetical protein TSH100_04200 [Azospirillum sp. TSH100]QCG92324.1 hypothetical protein E6C72_31455 [Azospirillum sp. TSH100]